MSRSPKGPKAAFALGAMALVAAAAAHAAEGDPIGNGIVAFDEGGSLTDAGSAIVVDASGRVYQFGTVATGASSHRMAIARFLPNGVLDAGFGTGGELVDPFGLALDSWGAAAQMLPSGKILLGGTVEFKGGNRSFFMGVLETSGIPNELFGVSGKGYTYESWGEGEHFLNAITADRLGRIVSVGTIETGVNDTDIGVSRLTASGIWDDSLTGDGTATVIFGSGPDRGLAVTTDGDNRIFIGGSAWTTGTGSDHDWAIAVLSENGAPDNTFDGNGLWVASGDGGGTNNDVIRDLDLWPDGTIVAAGDSDSDVDRSQFAVLAVAPTGGAPSVKKSPFCGTLLVPCSGGPQDSARALLLQGDEKIVIAGLGRGTTGTLDFAVARLDRDLTLDESFAGDGTNTFDFNRGTGAFADNGSAIAFDRDGRIVVGGSTEWNGPDTDMAWARFESLYIFADGFDWTENTSRWSGAVP